MVASARYKQAENITWRRVENELVLLNLDTSDYFTLNEIGGIIWERLGEGATIEDIQDKICQEYEVTAAQANKDITTLIAKLRKANLLLEIGGAG
jgi:hypothetical protein